MKLHFRKYGEGPTLIIMHGLFGSADNWNTLAKEFALKYSVYVLDMRNHGLSPHESEFNYVVMANDLNDFLVEHQLEDNVSIIGHSMGGKVLMQFLSMYPAKVSKAIVVDISPRYYPPHHHKVLQALSSVDFDVLNTRKEVEQIISPIIDDLPTTQFLLKNIYWKESTNTNPPQTKLAWRFNFDAISENIEEVGAASPEIPLGAHFQLLFMAGAKSNYITQNDLNIIHDYYESSKVVFVENAGHWVQAEQPKIFIEKVNVFLQS